ncbi:hypothetical protein HK101_005942 [Irineochytrium annulatum]|nr:hypothetical protein HK101_005942 [Irineochytrium annulatum]
MEQRAEDFMDEEDLAEIEAEKKMTATEEYDLTAGTEKELAKKRAVANSTQGSTLGPITGRFADDLIGPPRDSIGIKLLRLMGWREGQGIGAKVRKRDRDKMRKAGTAPPSTTAGLRTGLASVAGAEDDVYAEGHLFAPRDAGAVSIAAKADTFGLGYVAAALDGGAGREHNNDEDEEGGASRKRRRSPTKRKGFDQGGFGTGIFDEEEDMDVYSNVDRRGADYSAVIDDDDEDAAPMPRMASNREKSRQEAVPTKALPTAYKVGSDGRPPLPGFEFASVPLRMTTWYVRTASLMPANETGPRFDAPKPPPGYVPNQSALSGHLPGGVSGGGHNLTVDDRRLMLGEEALKGPTRSVFAYIQLKDQDRLQQFIDRATGATTTGSKDGDAAGSVPTTTQAMAAEGVDVSSAKAALRGFMPFVSDPAKQERYKRFLQWKAGTATEPAPPPHFTPREAIQEIHDFAKAALMYRPLTGLMATRFTSAATASYDLQAVADPSAPSAAPDADEKQDGEVKYGSRTRRRAVFKPEKLLCKRFNVANPYPEKKGDKKDSHIVAQPPPNEKNAVNFKAMADLREMAEVRVREDGAEGSTKKPIEQVEEKPEEAVAEPERPPMDIFKAIFADSDDDSEDDDEDDREEAIKDAAAMEETKLVAQAPDVVKVKSAVDGAQSEAAKPTARIAERAPATPAEPSTTAPLPPPTFRPLFTKKEARKPKIVERDPPMPLSVAATMTIAEDAADGEEEEEHVIRPPAVAASWATTAVFSTKKRDRAAAASQRRKADIAVGYDEEERQDEEETGEPDRKKKREKKDKKVKKRKEKKKRRRSLSSSGESGPDSAKATRVDEMDGGGVREKVGPALPPAIALRAKAGPAGTPGELTMPPMPPEGRKEGIPPPNDGGVGASTAPGRTRRPRAADFICGRLPVPPEFEFTLPHNNSQETTETTGTMEILVATSLSNITAAYGITALHKSERIGCTERLAKRSTSAKTASTAAQIRSWTC